VVPRYLWGMYMVTVLAVGVLIGGLERFVMSGPTTAGSLETMLLGICGAVFGGIVARAYGGYPTPLHPAGIVASIAGAILVLFINRLISQPRRTS
jgi:uncharacterized membrane protein YeaQ/YmgE (transglycosylase-associated protein family)